MNDNSQNHLPVNTYYKMQILKNPRPLSLPKTKHLLPMMQAQERFHNRGLCHYYFDPKQMLVSIKSVIHIIVFFHGPDSNLSANLKKKKILLPLLISLDPLQHSENILNACIQTNSYGKYLTVHQKYLQTLRTPRNALVETH